EFQQIILPPRIRLPGLLVVVLESVRGQITRLAAWISERSLGQHLLLLSQERQPMLQSLSINQDLEISLLPQRVAQVSLLSSVMAMFRSTTWVSGLCKVMQRAFSPLLR